MKAPIIVIFGITGDLAKRKLLPALYHLFSDDTLPADSVIIGTSRHQLTAEQLLKTVELCVLEKDGVCRPEGLNKIKRALYTARIDPNNLADFKSLKEQLNKIAPASQRPRLFYMSIPPSAYPPIISNLAGQGLNDPSVRLLLEKPFGYDVTSAEELITVIKQAFKENQVYRIDHYLAKETAQNLLTFRMHNPIFTPLWNCQHIDSVKVRGIQTIGIEGRANFYEQTGALRDFVQSHLMQLLALTMMELPEDMSADAIHFAKQQFFNSLVPADPLKALRGQYSGYKEEVGNPRSSVETYARVELSSNSPRWSDTKITLEHGKALNENTSDIAVEFKTAHERRHNSLIFQLQPNEGISLDLVVKEPGFSDRMHHAALSFSYQDSIKDYRPVDAYERVLMDVVAGDQSLFASAEEVLSTWRVLQPLIDNWQANTEGLKIYTAGSKPSEIF